MQAVILAGGLGTRLWPLTRQIPKPMIQVAGAPYLEHQLRYLGRQGFTDIVMLTGYLGEQISEHFSSGTALGLSIRYSKEEAPLGTGGALGLARDLLDDDFLLIYGDSYLPIDYAAVLNALRGSKALGAVVVYDNGLGDSSVRNNIAVDDAGMISHYDKDSGGSHLMYVDAGVLAFRRGITDRIRAGSAVSLEKEIFPVLIAERQLLAFKTSQRFFDIGTPERLKVIEELFAYDRYTDPLPD